MLYILTLVLPFLGFASGSLLGVYLGQAAVFISILFLFLTFFISCHLLYTIIQTNLVYKVIVGNWIAVNTYNIDWSFCYDSLTGIMLVIITGISSLVHLYSSDYMKGDPHLPRFMSYLSLFTFFMIILVTANNFLQMFVGWEGVGLSSFLLINFWFTRIQANKAAIKAMLVNRIGDFFIVFALLILLLTCNSLDYDIIFGLVPDLLNYGHVSFFGLTLTLIDIICLCLFLGAMGKSAQLLLHVWLPDAMEGPTPVSALIHAATMVTAGVFLLARCSFLFEYSNWVLNIVMLVGSTTAFFAATTGLFQNDVKKVIAYSTCSQLGYMVFACGLSSYEVGVFHLSNHAFFKALLFLSAGAIIHSVADEQDLRKLGGLRSLLPFSYSAMLIGSLALIGFPFLSGFYSKDTILELAYAKSTSVAFYCYVLGTLAAFCTAFYSFRVTYLIFLSNPNGNRQIYNSIHESSWPIAVPLFVLAVASIFVGFLSKDLFIGFGTDFWNNAIFVLPQNYFLLDVEFVSYSYKILPLCLTAAGLGSAYVLYVYKINQFFHLKQQPFFKIIYNFFSRKWYFDRLNNQVFAQNGLVLFEYIPYSLIDRGLLEAVGPAGAVGILTKVSNKISQFQSGSILEYLLIMLYVICSFILAVN